MNDPARTFGILIAYILPGFVMLWAIAQVSPVLEVWLTGTEVATPVLGGVVYVTAASIIVGMTLNSIRWLLIDSLHHMSGLRKPVLDDAKLQTNLEAFTRLVEDHFRYHQFYANTALAVVFGYPIWRSSESWFEQPIFFDVGIVILVFILVLSSRDALSRYYSRSEQLLG
ncbi:hypothetical protein COB72_05545 [bacterium]|nr:MAG: hypothetical protein COB72_05545 [bacterium]